MREHFERYLRERLKARGLSMSELARRSGMSRENLYRVMRGEIAHPTMESFHGLAGALEVSAIHLLRLYFDELGLGGGTLLPSRHAGDHVSFVRDVTIPDDTLVGPNQTFIKTWAIQNTGETSWRGRGLLCQDQDYVLARRLPGGALVPVVDCQLLPSTPRVPVPDAEPGEVVEVSAEFTTPTLPCSTLSLWKMVDADGVLCFPGHSGLWVRVRVVAL